MKCLECKHWTGDQAQDRRGFRQCSRIMMWEDIENRVSDNGLDQYSGSEEFVNAVVKIAMDTGAYVADGSAYFAGLFTGPDFFCARFELSQSEEPQ